MLRAGNSARAHARTRGHRPPPAGAPGRAARRLPRPGPDRVTGPLLLPPRDGTGSAQATVTSTDTNWLTLMARQIHLSTGDKHAGHGHDQNRLTRNWVLSGRAAAADGGLCRRLGFTGWGLGGSGMVAGQLAGGIRRPPQV
jgi:hypothetical protein